MWLLIWLVFCINEYHLSNAQWCTALFLVYLKPGDLIPELYRLETLARAGQTAFWWNLVAPQAQPCPQNCPGQNWPHKIATCLLAREVNWAMWLSFRASWGFWNIPENLSYVPSFKHYPWEPRPQGIIHLNNLCHVVFIMWSTEQRATSRQVLCTSAQFHNILYDLFVERNNAQ